MSTTPSITRAEAQRICNLLGVYMAMDDYAPTNKFFLCYTLRPVFSIDVNEWLPPNLHCIGRRSFTVSDYDGTAANSLISPEGM